MTFQKAVQKFDFHPSILRIENKVDDQIFQNLFSFTEMTQIDILKEIKFISNKIATS